jgi:hypothetical protein
VPSLRPLVAVLASAALFAPAALSATHEKKPQPKAVPPPGTLVRKHVPAGMAAARHALLDRGELGAGWAASAAPATSAALTCPAHEPALTGIVETGAASSAGFRASATGPFLAQSAWVYETAAQGTTYWRRVTGPGVVNCLVDVVQRGTTQSVSFSVVGRSRIALPQIAPHTAGYRVTATATSAGQVARVYFDLVLLGRGDTLTELTLARFVEPPAPAQELAIARLAARRL